MLTLWTFWIMQPPLVKLLLLALLSWVAASLPRLVRPTRLLHRRPLSSSSEHDDPHMVASRALAGRLPVVSVSRLFTESAQPNQSGLLAARDRYECLWEQCAADVQFVKNASVGSFLLTMAAVILCAFPIYSDFMENSKLIGMTAMILTVKQLLDILALGLFLCTLQYTCASSLQWKLARRRAEWQYYCSGSVNSPHMQGATPRT